MKTKDFLKTWEGTQTENKWGRLFIAGLIVVNFMMMIKIFAKETVVILQPYTLSQEASITKGMASKSYVESWGMFFAQMLGNVTPSTVGFLKERLSPLLDPAVYQTTIDALEVQAQQIRDDRVTFRFEPRFVEYEESVNRVFVYGYSYMRGATNKEERTEKTFEFHIEISNYAPLLKFMDTYAGKPKTALVLEQLKRKEESRKRNEK